MDAELYVTGKAAGDSGMELHGESTVLVRLPGGFDAKTGAKLPPVERGYQREDLQAARDAAAGAVESAQTALAKAQGCLAAFDALLADADAILPKPVEVKIGVRE